MCGLCAALMCCYLIQVQLIMYVVILCSSIDLELFFYVMIIVHVVEPAQATSLNKNLTHEQISE
jgi:hypothetical protein